MGSETNAGESEGQTCTEEGTAEISILEQRSALGMAWTRVETPLSTFQQNEVEEMGSFLKLHTRDAGDPIV